MIFAADRIPYDRIPAHGRVEFAELFAGNVPEAPDALQELIEAHLELLRNAYPPAMATAEARQRHIEARDRSMAALFAVGVAADGGRR